MRLFAAVRPPTAVLAHLDLALSVVTGPLGPEASRGAVRWTAPENRHLTTAFYGEVPDGALPDLLAALEVVAASIPPFEVRLHGAGVFSGRTLWIGAAGDVRALAGLSSLAADAGREVALPYEDRTRSRAHLTVARLGRSASSRRPPRREQKLGAGGLQDLAHALALYDGPVWQVRELLLVRSRPGEGPSGGPRYDDLAALPLGPSSENASVEPSAQH